MKKGLVKHVINDVRRKEGAPAGELTRSELADFSTTHLRSRYRAQLGKQPADGSSRSELIAALATKRPVFHAEQDSRRRRNSTASRDHWAVARARTGNGVVVTGRS